MINHCLTPNPKYISNSKCQQHMKHCNCSPECICFSNYYSPNSKYKNIDSELLSNIKNEKKITYEINSNLSPNSSLKKNQSMLYQNLSTDLHLKKNNSLFNIRDKNYQENQINSNPKNLVSNSQNILPKCSMNYYKKEKLCMNKNLTRNNTNKKDELFEKIRFISNKIDETINLYKDKNYSNLNKNNDDLIRNHYINKYNNLPLNFQYNNSKIFENMKKEIENRSELINLKIKNLSQYNNNPINVYKRICNNYKINRDNKKIKVNYAKLNKQKKFYIDNNINLNRINDNKHKNISDYYKLQEDNNTTEQIYIKNEPLINCYKSKGNNIYNKYNKYISYNDKNINTEKLTYYIRNNSFDESINAKRNKCEAIKNLKKNLYEKETKNNRVIKKN